MNISSIDMDMDPSLFQNFSKVGSLQNVLYRLSFELTCANKSETEMDLLIRSDGYDFSKVSVLQCLAVFCSVLQCVAVCCCVLLYVAVCCSVLQCGAVFCSVLQYVIKSHYSTSPSSVCCSVLQRFAVCCSMLQCVAVGCSVLQYVAMCCSVLQCMAVCHKIKLQYISVFCVL